MVGIYKITNPIGQVYIGQSNNLDKRFSYYKSNNFRNQKKIKDSIDKYGYDKHTFEIIWLCNKFELNYFERKFQLKFNSTGDYGLNMSLCSDNEYKGKLSEHTKNRIRDKAIGRKHSYSHRENNSKAKLGNNSASRSVINIKTGEEFVSLKEASEYYNLNYGTLKNKISGFRKNNTNLIYKNDIP